MDNSQIAVFVLPTATLGPKLGEWKAAWLHGGRGRPVSVVASTSFRLQHVLSVAFSAIRGRWAAMLVFTLLLSYAPAVAQTQFHALGGTVSVHVDIPPAVPGTRPPASGHLGPSEGFVDLTPVAIGWFLFSMLCAVAMTAALTSLTISSVNAGAAPWRTAVTAILRCFVPLTLITLLGSGAIILGLLVLIPGIWLMTVWVVAGPAEIAERNGVFGSFRRSAVLTRGHRWPILSLLVLWAAIFVVGQMLTGVIFVMLGHAGNGSNISGPLFGSVSSIAYDVGAAALYLELLRAKDGVGLGEVDQIFD